MKESEFNTLLLAAGIAGDTDTVGNADVGYADGGYNKMDGLPYAFGRFGLVSGTAFSGLASGGQYWSGTVKSSSQAYALNYGGSSLYPAYQGGRYVGRNVRCLAR